MSSIYTYWQNLLSPIYITSSRFMTLNAIYIIRMTLYLVMMTLNIISSAWILDLSQHTQNYLFNIISWILQFNITELKLSSCCFSPNPFLSFLCLWQLTHVLKLVSCSWFLLLLHLLPKRHEFLWLAVIINLRFDHFSPPPLPLLQFQSVSALAWTVKIVS